MAQDEFFDVVDTAKYEGLLRPAQMTQSQQTRVNSFIEHVYMLQRKNMMAEGPFEYLGVRLFDQRDKNADFSGLRREDDAVHVYQINGCIYRWPFTMSIFNDPNNTEREYNARYGVDG